MVYKKNLSQKLSLDRVYELCVTEFPNPISQRVLKIDLVTQRGEHPAGMKHSSCLLYPSGLTHLLTWCLYGLLQWVLLHQLTFICTCRDSRFVDHVSYTDQSLKCIMRHREESWELSSHSLLALVTLSQRQKHDSLFHCLKHRLGLCFS